MQMLQGCYLGGWGCGGRVDPKWVGVVVDVGVCSTNTNKIKKLGMERRKKIILGNKYEWEGRKKYE